MKKFLKLILIASNLFIISCDNQKNMTENDIYKFPNNFLWGTSTASYQIEGGITNDWSKMVLMQELQQTVFINIKKILKK